jgi:hypothetical protein
MADWTPPRRVITDCNGCSYSSLDLGDAGYINTSYSNKGAACQGEAQDHAQDEIGTTESPLLSLLDHKAAGPRIQALLGDDEVGVARQIFDQRRERLPSWVPDDRLAARFYSVEYHISLLEAAFTDPPKTDFTLTDWPDKFAGMLDCEAYATTAFAFFYESLLDDDDEPFQGTLEEAQKLFNEECDQAPFEEMAVADRARVQKEAKEWEPYRQALFASDRGVLEGGVTASQLSLMTRSIRNHGHVDAHRGVEASFDAVESSILLSIPPGCFGGGGEGGGQQRAFIVVSSGNHIRQHTVRLATNPNENEKWDDGYIDDSNLFQVSISVLFPGDDAFSPLLSLSYTTRCTPNNPYPTFVEKHGLTSDESTANRLEEFACGSVRPHTSHCGVLVRTMITCGVGEGGFYDNGASSRAALLVLSQQQDSLGLPRPAIGEYTAQFNKDGRALRTKYQLMDLGASSFVRDYPDIHISTLSSEEVQGTFMSEVETDVSGFVPLGDHAKTVVESMLDFAGMGHASCSEIDDAIGGWEEEVSERIFEGGMITAPPPNIVE